MIYWHSGVSASDSVDSVLRFAREFQASWTPEEIARLPEDCRPRVVKSAGDLDFWSARLSEAYLKQVQAANVETVLAQFVHFFLHAALRCRQLASTEPRPDEGSSAGGESGCRPAKTSA